MKETKDIIIQGTGPKQTGFCHFWRATTRDGSEVSGVDNMPDVEVRQAAVMFELITPENSSNVIMIPPRRELVFFRRGQFDVYFGTFKKVPDSDRWCYVLGYKDHPGRIKKWWRKWRGRKAIKSTVMHIFSDGSLLLNDDYGKLKTKGGIGGDV